MTTLKEITTIGFDEIYKKKKADLKVYYKQKYEKRLKEFNKIQQQELETEIESKTKKFQK